MTSPWMQQLGLKRPVVQAGMGGGVSGSALAAATSLAGGLGTIGIDAPSAFRQAIQSLKAQCGDQPYAVNLLVPFLRRGHIDACLELKPPVAVLFLGGSAALIKQLKTAGIQVWQQVGSVAEAERAIARGVEGLIAQGVEAGGHQAGDVPLAELLVSLRQQYPALHPLLAAGGIYDEASARQACALGADGVVAGTRFLLTHECEAHQEYKQRLLLAEHTVRTQLFGLGWPATHRVADNAATRRWLKADGAEPRWVHVINRAMVPVREFLPLNSGPLFVRCQRVPLPLFSPFPVLEGMSAKQIDTTPLYAGVNVAKIKALATCAEVVEELAQGCAC